MAARRNFDSSVGYSFIEVKASDRWLKDIETQATCEVSAYASYIFPLVLDDRVVRLIVPRTLLISEGLARTNNKDLSPFFIFSPRPAKGLLNYFYYNHVLLLGLGLL